MPHWMAHARPIDPMTTVGNAVQKSEGVMEVIRVTSDE